jgi:lipopolysaccharide biosynthesis regulator YciM
VGRGARYENESTDDQSNYFRGLNYLLDEQPDSAVDSFIAALEVNDQTLETHFVLGQLLRRQGQPDRAIRIHQNLLARPGLDSSYRYRAKYELALDFSSSGLFDRSARILDELVAEKNEYRDLAAQKLLSIHLSEHEWEEGVQLIDRLSSRRLNLRNKARPLRRVKSHLCAQIAEDAIATGNFTRAGEWLKRAKDADVNCPRGWFVDVQLAQAEGKYAQAKKALAKVIEHDPARVPYYLSYANDLYNSDHDLNGFLKYLDSAIQAGAPEVFQLFYLRTLITLKGPADRAVKSMLSELMTTTDSLIATKLYLDVLRQEPKGFASELAVLQRVVGERIGKHNLFKCTNCGFKGQELHWNCPSCKEWESIVSNNDVGVKF